jgi:hypothetical protein
MLTPLASVFDHLIFLEKAMTVGFFVIMIVALTIALKPRP